jgi:hypothetical protein
MDSFQNQLLALLAAKRLKSDIDAAAATIEDDPLRLGQAIDLYLESETPIRERLAWTLQVATEIFPSLVNQALQRQIFNLMEQARSDAERRAFLNILRNDWLPDDLLGPAYDFCLAWMADPQMAIAVRVYCLDILLQIVDREPELARELELVTDEIMAMDAPPAFLASRRKKIAATVKRSQQAKSKSKRAKS